MELKHDWRAFNAVLFPQEVWNDKGAQKLAILEDNGRVVDGVVSSGALFTDQGEETPTLSKERLDGFASKYGVEQATVLHQKALTDAIADASRLGSNYYQQLQFIRERVVGGGEGKGRRRLGRNQPVHMVSREHFLLDFLAGPAARLLPRTYNFLVFIDTGRADDSYYQALMLHMNLGKVDQFFEPDFSSLHEGRLIEWEKHTDTIGEYLENRYLMPCFGVYAKKAVWDRALASSRQHGHPWQIIAKASDTGGAAVYPKTFMVKSLLAAQRMLMYFGRA